METPSAIDLDGIPAELAGTPEPAVSETQPSPTPTAPAPASPADTPAVAVAPVVSAPSSTPSTPAPTPEPVAAPAAELDSPAPTPNATGPISPEQVQKWRSEAIDKLAGQYAIDDATRAQLEEAPATVIPRLLARLHVDMVDTMYRVISQAVPNIVRQQATAQDSHRSFTTKFGERWPQLKSHYGKVNDILKVHRQLNPSDSEADLIEKVGLQASVMLKLPIASSGQMAVPSVASVAPALTFTPASPAGGSRATASTPSRTVWEELIEEVEN